MVAHICHCKTVLKCIARNKFMCVTVLAIVLGVVIGFILRHHDVSHNGRVWIKIWGELFLRMLSVIILPIIMSCLIVGTAQLEGTSGGMLGIVSLLYIFITQFIGVSIGVIFAAVFQPGSRWDDAKHSNHTFTNTQISSQTHTGSGSVLSAAGKPINSTSTVNYSDIFADFLRNLFPDNIVKACLQHVYTKQKVVITTAANNTNLTHVVTHLIYQDGTNTLGIIVFSLAVGFAIAGVGKDGKALYNVFYSLFKVSFWLMDIIILYSPIAITSLIATSIMEVEDVSSVLTAVGIYISVFLVCSVLHHCIILPMLYYVIVRKNPFKYYVNFLLDGVIAGFIPPTSVVAIPMIQTRLKQKDEIDERVADFFFPVALGINRDGSAMFVCYTLMFIAQSQNVVLTFGDVFMIWLLGGILSIAIADVPSGSVMLMMTMAPAVNITIGDRLAVIMALEWIMDRVRTTTNISSTGFGAAIIDKFVQGRLHVRTVDGVDDDKAKINHTKQKDSDCYVDDNTEYSDTCDNDEDDVISMPLLNGT